MKAQSPWTRASEMAGLTPESRNRYVDFLRMLSILSVVVGHWMMAAPYLVEGKAVLGHMLDLAPWSRWMTWLMQVMPVFFFVGGFSNGTSWDAALRKKMSYSAWLDRRLRRLLGPVLPLLLVWMVLSILARAGGAGPQTIHIASRTALVPLWFLAIYILVILFVPISRKAWHQWGYSSIFVPVLAAGCLDYAYFAMGRHTIAWLNYLFVWTAVHQLGYAWLDGRVRGLSRSLPIGLFGLAALVFLTRFGPYPLSLVGVPSESVSNTLPPKLPLLALAAAQFGFLLSFEGIARRFLARRIPWTLTVLINGLIMSIFLWHSTIMVLIIGVVFTWLPGFVVFHPGSTAWWAMRPLWILAYSVVLTPVVLLVAPFEGGGPSRERVPSLLRLLPGCFLACGGLAFLAYGGIGAELQLVTWGPLLAVFAGTAIAGITPLTACFRSSKGA